MIGNVCPKSLISPATGIRPLFCESIRTLMESETQELSAIRNFITLSPGNLRVVELMVVYWGRGFKSDISPRGAERSKHIRSLERSEVSRAQGDVLQTLTPLGLFNKFLLSSLRAPKRSTSTALGTQQDGVLLMSVCELGVFSWLFFEVSVNI